MRWQTTEGSGSRVIAPPVSDSSVRVGFEISELALVLETEVMPLRS